MATRCGRHYATLSLGSHYATEVAVIRLRCHLWSSIVDNLMTGVSPIDGGAELGTRLRD